MKKEFLSFSKARNLACSFKLKNKTEWEKIPIQKLQKYKLPRDARAYYKDKWVSWGEFLGNGNLKHGDKAKLFLSYKIAQAKIRKFKLANRQEFRKWIKTYKAFDLPKAPSIVYKNKGWKNWSEFLGTDNLGSKAHAYKFLSHSKARALVRKLHFKNKIEFKLWTKNKITKNSLAQKLPNFPRGKIPSDPELAYKGKGFKDLRDFLGTDNLAFYQKKTRPFDKAYRFVRNLNKNKQLIQTQMNWQAYCKVSKQNKKFKTIQSGKFKGLLVKPKNIPDKPELAYKDKWRDWSYFLIWIQPKLEPIKYLPYKEAKKFVCKLKLKNQAQWREYTKASKITLKTNSKACIIAKGKFKEKSIKPINIPNAVYQYYKAQKNENFNWGDFLGTGNIQNQKKRKKTN